MVEDRSLLVKVTTCQNLAGLWAPGSSVLEPLYDAQTAASWMQRFLILLQRMTSKIRSLCCLLHTFVLLSHLYCSCSGTEIKMMTDWKPATISKKSEINLSVTFDNQKHKEFISWKTIMVGNEKHFAFWNQNQSHFLLDVLFFPPDKIGKLYNLLLCVFVIFSAVMQRPFPSLLG